MNLKYFYWAFIRARCPGCKGKLEECVVLASYEPHASCGSCGYIFDKKQRGEILEG